MAEGFARVYGSDVMEALSAGLAPAEIIQPLTMRVMKEKNISLEEQRSKDLGEIDLQSIDLIINISGRPLPSGIPVEVRQWRVDDPIGKDEKTYIAARDQIERLVMELILELRRERRTPKRGPSLRSLLNRDGAASDRQ
jgi:protein-tyrosine-phosphatase